MCSMGIAKAKVKVKSILAVGFKGIGKIIRPVYSALAKDVYVIVNIEGGLASQLEQYTMGQLIETMGYSVVYDLSSYTDGCSLDVLGKNARNLDITKLDRSIELKEADSKTLKIYRRFFRYSEKKSDCKQLTSKSKLPCPVYLGGYGYGFFSEEEFERVYAKSIKIDFDMDEFGQINNNLLSTIKSWPESIGMHVRRGDTLLAKVGRPIPKKEYYLEALAHFENRIPIYIFSDDMQWVKEELLPYIPCNERCVTVENNGADRGWCDLILMATCTYQIKSPTGGLGREAYRLNQNSNRQLILPVYIKGNDSHMLGNIKEIVLTETTCDLQYVKEQNTRL